jgi:hypothetical protein
MTPLSEQLRQFVDDEKGRGVDGGSRYAICRRTGGVLSQSQMSIFMGGGLGLSLSKLDALCEVLDLQLVKRPAADPVEQLESEGTDADK